MANFCPDCKYYENYGYDGRDSEHCLHPNNMYEEVTHLGIVPGCDLNPGDKNRSGQCKDFIMLEKLTRNRGLIKKKSFLNKILDIVFESDAY